MNRWFVVGLVGVSGACSGGAASDRVSDDGTSRTLETTSVETASEGDDSPGEAASDPAALEPAVGPTGSDAPPITDGSDTTSAATTTTSPIADDVATSVGEPVGEIATVFAGTGRAGDPWAPIGWWDGAEWQPPALVDGVPQPVPASEIETVSLTGLDIPEGRDQVIDSLSLGPDEPYCVNEEVGPVIEFEPDVPDTPTSLGYDVVAVTASWPLQPRPVRRGDLDDPDLARAAVAFVPGVADATDGQVAQVVIADLDGDGRDENLVVVERQTDPQGAEGDFSIVMVRSTIADGSNSDEALVAVEIVDPASLESPYPTTERYTIAAVADLNGDGLMEVAVRNRFFESAGVELYGYVDGALAPLGLRGGCGV